MRRLIRIALPLAVTAGLATSAQAQLGPVDSLVLTSARPYGWVPGGFVGPYQAQVITQPGMPFIDVFCVDYLNSIWVGDRWQANISYLNGDLANTRFNDVVKYQQAAWLSLQFSSANKSDWASIHGAIWNITSPGSPSIGGNAVAQAYLAQAQNVANYGSIRLDDWVVVTDVNTVNGVGGKQEYLAYVAPEPGTMILLGTGLAGLAAARRRRRNGLTEADRG